MGVNKSVLSEFGHVVGLQMLFNIDPAKSSIFTFSDF